MSVIRRKVRVSQLHYIKDATGKAVSEQVDLIVAGSQNATSSDGPMPFLNITLMITNPDEFGKLANGHEFFVDFTPAEVAG